ncbi:MAG: aminopeptidase [Actinomycetota bacterium]|nr:aminopeptidase [Actinomycetota bacterium]
MTARLELAPAVETVLSRCLAVRAGEDVLVVADPATLPIAEALREGASAEGAEAVLSLMDERRTHGSEPPRPLEAAFSACDVLIAPTTKSLSHTTARKGATDAGVRAATMPGVTGDMLARAMAVDFALMARRSRAVAAALTEGAVARVSCPKGTDLTLELGNRAGIADDGDLSAPGAFGNLPCGEGFISPTGGEGELIASSLASLGLSDEPAVLTVQEGGIVGAERGLGPQFMALLRAHGEAGANLAELGVGTNDRAQLTGAVLEDEKILGTIHVAFGASAGIGGTVSVPIHLDVVVTDASLEVDGQPILDNGRFVLDVR